MQVIVKSAGLYLAVNAETAEELLNLAGVCRVLEIDHGHLRQLLHRGRSVSDALNYLVSKKGGGDA
ncbi:hypothetical protein ACN5OL_001014 [Cronobacter sakazakii]